MHGVFIQGRRGMTWLGMVEGPDDPEVTNMFNKDDPDVDFVLVIEVAKFVDVDGEREG